MNRTKIPWATHTTNPMHGCSPCSEGCANCYAAAMARRFHRQWGAPVWAPNEYKRWDRAIAPSRPYAGRRIFIGSATDIFHPAANPDRQDSITQWLKAFSWSSTWIMLTKRPENMVAAWTRRFRDSGSMYGFWPHIWLGFTAENQCRMDQRAPFMDALNRFVRFVSVEPMLGPVRLPPNVDWVIAGPENGPRKRPCDPAWITNLEYQCRAVGVPFFDKRDGPNRTRQYPDPLAIQQHFNISNPNRSTPTNGAA